VWASRKTGPRFLRLLAIGAIALTACTKANLVVEDYELGLRGLRPGYRSHPALATDGAGAQHYLTVTYDATVEEGPSRDLWAAPRERNWFGARALRFRVRPGGPLVLTVSFVDKNGLGFTQRTGRLEPSIWQPVTLPLDRFWFNRFAQPDRPAAPPDLAEVSAFGFAPVSAEGGRFAIDDFTLVR
jgi:hypothetical protein